MQTIHQKYKANESISRHNSKKKKKKQSIKIEYKPYAKKTHGYEMIINKKKKNLKRKNCLLPQIS
jgi:hypothetical protein